MNAILNYLYTLLESEARLAITALGLDPGFGLLHVDHATRDSLVYDLMEPVRPKIDVYVLDWITRTPLKRSWFFEQRDGTCRLMADLTVQLSDTASTWAREVAPIVEWYAETFSASLSDKGVPAASTRLTRRKRFEGKGGAVPEIEPARKQHSACETCGAIITPGYRFCGDCEKIERGKRLAAAQAKGKIAASTPEVAALKSAKMLEQRKAIAAWDPAELPSWLDDNFYATKLQPMLKSISISLLANALNISTSHAYRFVKGAKIPHRRHWLRLAELVGVSKV